MNRSETLHWRRKLHALLHDPPDKAVDIGGHGLRALLLQSLDGFEEEERFDKDADHAASAADRIPFPKANCLSQKFATLSAYPHPLGGAHLTKGDDFGSGDEALETSQKTRPFLLDGGDPRSAFICAWRFWRNWASDADPRFHSLPADTRLPDHSIWHHMAVTSAFQGALPSPEQRKRFPGEKLRPRLLLFSVGPVQDFIAAARSTRDLWSGSYLLSWLVSRTLAKIAREVGPDQVIFPNLIDQPLIDRHLSREIYDSVKFDGTPVSEGFGFFEGEAKLQRLLTPSLPNRFLALLPARLPHDDSTTDEYARQLAKGIRAELGAIAASVADHIAKHPLEGVIEFDRAVFDEQLGKLLEVHWQTLPLPDSLHSLIDRKEGLQNLLPPDEPGSDEPGSGYAPRRAVESILAMIEAIPEEHRDTRYFDAEGRLNQPVVAWGLLNALLAWLHDGTKALREFDGWREGRWKSGKDFNKDALNGKEEAVLRVRRPDGELGADELKRRLESHCANALGMSKGTFKPGELLGASTLVKRLWHETWLPSESALGMAAWQIREAMPMPNTRSIAAGRPFAQELDDTGKTVDEDDGTDANGKDSYFAILALDGDEMGKWISGSKSPKMGHSLSPDAVNYFKERAPGFLEAPRAVTPSWHLQFSESLGNFGLHAAQRVVEAFNGRLIYAGGDDVLAMLPASEALACARALRAAFRGESALNGLAKGVLKGRKEKRQSDRETVLFDIADEGYLRLHPDSGARGGDEAALLSDPVRFPALVPGPAADVSVGIAVAHFKAPLQDVVRAAQAAEKRAKRKESEGGLGRAAVAVSIFKRSGEILEWGSRWAAERKDPASGDSAGCRLLAKLVKELGPEGRLNARFPHKLEALLSNYLPGSDKVSSLAGFDQDFGDIIALELDHCLSRNEGGRLDSGERALFGSYWKELEGLDGLRFEARVERFIHLLRAAAWMRRSDASAKCERDGEEQSDVAWASSPWSGL